MAIHRCLLSGEQTNALLEWLPQAAFRLGLTAFDPIRRRGLLRRVSVQEARGTRELLVTLLTGRGQPQPLERLATEMSRRFPRLVGVVRSELSRDDRPEGSTILAGRDYIHEVLEGDQYRIPCEAFFQPNPLGSLAVRRHALAALALRAGGSLPELCSGVGFLTLGAARASVRTTAVSRRPGLRGARVNPRRAPVMSASSAPASPRACRAFCANPGMPSRSIHRALVSRSRQPGAGRRGAPTIVYAPVTRQPWRAISGFSRRGIRLAAVTCSRSSRRRSTSNASRCWRG